MKTAMILSSIFLISACVPDNSESKRQEAERQEQIELHEQRSRDWGHVGETEVFEGFK